MQLCGPASVDNTVSTTDIATDNMLYIPITNNMQVVNGVMTKAIN